MYLENVRPPKFSYDHIHNKIALVMKQSARTPPSTFLFLPIHLSNSPRISQPSTSKTRGSPSKTRRTDEAFQSPTKDRSPVITAMSDVLQQTASRPFVGGRRRQFVLYRADPVLESTTKTAKKIRRVFAQGSISPRGVQPTIRPSAILGRLHCFADCIASPARKSDMAF